MPVWLKERVEGATAVHDFEKFWEHMRQDRNSSRPALTDEQRLMKRCQVMATKIFAPEFRQKVALESALA